MIKFFRKIRQNLLNKNKVGKYLLYAFGEIILVIIGILIALNLNKRSEQKQAEAKIDAIFEDVLLELEVDINESTNIIKNYLTKDSLASLVLNAELTYDDYADENSSNLWRIATQWGNYYTSSNAYNLLMTNVDAIPNKFNQAVRTLNRLHSRQKPNVEKYNYLLEQLVVRNYDDFEENYTWYNESDFKKSNDAIEYRLNNYKYKNKIKRFRGEAFTHRVHIGRYRFYSIRAYKEIATILGKSLDSLDFIIDYKSLVKYTGSYVNDLVPDSKINISNEEEYLILKSRGEDNSLLLGLSSKQVFFPGTTENRFYRFHENNKTKTITLSEYKGHEVITYTKVNTNN